MRKSTVVLVAFISFIALYAYAGSAARTIKPRVQLLGFTEARVEGNGFGLVAACDAEFSGSHVCRQRDLMRTGTVPESVAVLDPEEEEDWAWIDGRGLQAEGHSLVCGLPGFIVRSNGTDNILQGAAVGSDGAIHRIGCAAQVRVACCGLPRRR
jgi:hypothetical protein